MNIPFYPSEYQRNVLRDLLHNRVLQVIHPKGRIQEPTKAFITHSLHGTKLNAHGVWTIPPKTVAELIEFGAIEVLPGYPVHYNTEKNLDISYFKIADKGRESL